MTSPRLSGRVLAFTFAATLALPAAVMAQPARRPLQQSDFDPWRSIASQTLSRDGRQLAYSYMPQDGDGDLIVRDLKTGKERREDVGALPPPLIQSPEEVNPEEPPQPRRVRISFTADGRFVVATSYPTKTEVDKAKKEKKGPEEMPKGGLVILDLVGGGTTRVGAVKSVQVPSKGGSVIAYLREAPAPDRSEDRRAAAPARPGRGERKEFGTELVLRDLAKASGGERVFPGVLDYSFARDGKTLIYSVSSRKEEDNGVYAVTPGTDAAPVALASGKGKYARLAWDREQGQAAFLSDRDDVAAKAPRFKVYRWTRGAPAAAQVLSWDTPGVSPGLLPSDKGALSFSRDGSKLYVAAAPPAKPAADSDGEAPADDKVLADLWHWKDDLVQPMQKVRANQERNRSYRGVLHIAEQRYVQIADSTLRTASFSDDGMRALGLDDSPYRRMIDYDGGYNDVYLIDTETGQRRLAVKQLRGGGGGGGFGGGGGGFAGPLQWAPDGKHAFYYQDRHWHLLDALTGAPRNVTGSLGVAFHDEEDDTPDPASSYGQAGWARDSQSFLLNDRYDVWQVFADGRAARNLTAGDGRKTRVELRVQRLEPQDEDDDERGIDTQKPLTLRGTSQETRATGFLRTTFAGGAPPQRLVWGERNYRLAGRAQEADVLLVSASRFDEYPDLHTTDMSFTTPLKVTNGGAQKDGFSWGKGELIPFRNTDGVGLKAALYKPDGFDPKKKYPLLVYIYERLSQNVHNFAEPRPSHNVNFSLYVSNGYLILTPDIVYTIGQPGQSALKCVLPAIQAVVEKGFVDENAIGIQGHSWGGYQIAYMVTQTNRFKAAETGAPVGNMTSAYSGIRWGTGLPRQFQYEQTQSRIGRSLYEAPLKFIENSPIFHVPRVQTPLLILHNDQDDAVPWYQGIELFLALRRNGKEAYLWSYNGEFHGLRRRHNQKDYSLRMQQFFDHFLKGAPKPEWMEKGIRFVDREEEKARLLRTLDR